MVYLCAVRTCSRIKKWVLWLALLWLLITMVKASLCHAHNASCQLYWYEYILALVFGCFTTSWEERQPVYWTHRWTEVITQCEQIKLGSLVVPEIFYRKQGVCFVTFEGRFLNSSVLNDFFCLLQCWWFSWTKALCISITSNKLSIRNYKWNFWTVLCVFLFLNSTGF